jgi:hypothetical protein
VLQLLSGLESCGRTPTTGSLPRPLGTDRTIGELVLTYGAGDETCGHRTLSQTVGICEHDRFDSNL